jgi:hypothetical protein
MLAGNGCLQLRDRCLKSFTLPRKGCDPVGLAGGVPALGLLEGDGRFLDFDLVLALCARQVRADPCRGWRQEGRQDRRVFGPRGRLRREGEAGRCRLEAAKDKRGIGPTENVPEFSESRVELSGRAYRFGLAVLRVPRARASPGQWRLDREQLWPSPSGGSRR